MLVSIAFYGWLLYAVFLIPASWVIAVIGLTAGALGVSSVYGYQRWLRDARLPDTEMSVVSLKTIVLFMTSVGAPTWVAIYLVWRGHLLAGSLAALAAAAVSWYGVTHLKVFQPPVNTSLPSMQRDIPTPLRLFRALMVFFCVAAPLAIAAILFVEHEIVAAAIVLVPVVAIAPRSIRYIRAELK